LFGGGNLISGNGFSGVAIAGKGNNRVWGNYIGTNAAGTTAVPNRINGVYVQSTHNTIGGFTPYPLVPAGNLISGNGSYGIYLAGGVNEVQANLIGTDAAGTAAVPNGTGVQIVGAGNLIGGTQLQAGNLISGNAGDGVRIEGATSSGNQLQGNFIGTNLAGSAALGNQTTGVSLKAPGNVVGGMTASARNLISGNEVHGILINDLSAAGNQVLGNFLGTDGSGTAAIGNGNDGVQIASGAANNVIGGTSAAARNILAGGYYGVFIAPTSGTGNRVQGNFIGTNAAGTGALGNQVGVGAFGPGSLIGGPTAGAGNLISGNALQGIDVEFGPGNVIQGNRIGTDAEGLGALPNGIGVGIAASSTTVGGPGGGAGNRIAFNTRAGVALLGDTSVGNGIRGNAIWGNGALGIDLGRNGVTPNDPAGGPRTGPNRLQNYPEITGVSVAGGTVAVTGRLKSLPGATFTLDFYRSASADPSGFGQGQVYLGSRTVTTNSAGNAIFNTSFPVPGNVSGQFIAATASRNYGGGVFETSEFSNAVQAP
jgi:titin